MAPNYRPIAQQLAAALRLRPCACVRKGHAFPHRANSPDFQDEICHAHKVLAEFEAMEKQADQPASTNTVRELRK